jgi:hypothetical protein
MVGSCPLQSQLQSRLRFAVRARHHLLHEKDYFSQGQFQFHLLWLTDLLHSDQDELWGERDGERERIHTSNQEQSHNVSNL